MKETLVALDGSPQSLHAAGLLELARATAAERTAQRDERAVSSWVIPMAVLVLAARVKLRRCARVGKQPTVHGRVWIHGAGHIVLGDRVVLDGSVVPIELYATEGAQIFIGDDVRIEGGASIEAVQLIVVGARSVLGPYCKVLDNNLHPVSGDRHARPPSSPVAIGEDVVLGRKSIVLPGSQLGRGVQLEEGVVISRHVPADSVLAGYPPRLVRRGSCPC